MTRSDWQTKKKEQKKRKENDTLYAKNLYFLAEYPVSVRYA